MLQRLVFTFATAISLTGLYALYSVAMRPVVVIAIPPVRTTSEDGYVTPERPAENVRVASTYLPAHSQSWAPKSMYMLKADHAFVYTNNWHPDEESGKRVKFIPFAMAWLTNDKDGHEQAVSMVSESAQLEFDSTFDEKNPAPGRVVRAVLNGDVEISGPDGLAIRGRHFIFDESDLSLYTTNPVHFRFQSHRGSATRMSMKLIPAEGLPGKDRPHVYGIESIRLVGGPRPGDPRNPYVQLEALVPQDGELKPVKVRCAGELEYTVGTNLAVFTKDVVVSTGTDWLECDTLTMQFNPKKPDPDENLEDSANPPKEELVHSPEYQHVETNLEFSWLEAEGRDVKIISRSRGFKAYMNRLTYSAETRILSMRSRDGVRVVQQGQGRGTELQAPDIEIQLGDGPAPSLSSLNCVGAGTLKIVDEKLNRSILVARWQKKLGYRPDDETQLDLIEFEGGAQFFQPEKKTGLGAELVRIWLAPTKFDLSASADGTAGREKTPEPEPKRVLAQHDVVMQSPKMQIVKSNELDIRFEDEGPVTPPTVSHQSRSRLLPAALVTAVDQRTRRSASAAGMANGQGNAGSSQRQTGFASIPAASDGSLGPAIDYDVEGSPRPRSAPKRSVPSAVDEPAQPIVVAADRIDVRMRRIPGEPDPVVTEVHSEGKVTVTQQRKPGEKELRFQGDRVDLQSESKNHEVVAVHGSPALIRDRGYQIEGKEIHLDRGENQAWVTGPGELRLPIPEQTKIPGLGSGGNSRDLRVWWNESMKFDGLEGKFLGKVGAKLGLGTMHCEQMIVQLVDRISFQATEFADQPALRLIHCREDVSFENSTYADKKLTDKYRGRVGEFTVNHVLGEVVAQGPGTILAWQRQDNGSSGFSPRDTIQANRPIPVEVTVWDYTRVQFEGQLKGYFDVKSTGKTNRQRAVIDDRVEVIRGPVKQPNETVDPDELPSGAGMIRCDQLQFVNHPQSLRTPAPYRELIGRGNAEVEGQVDGRRFTASADEISFDGSKDLYLLRAHGKQNARLNQQVGTSGLIVGRRIEFNPKKKSLYVDRATEGQGSQ
jgi:lipopolysaccharide export system protein LptA